MGMKPIKRAVATTGSYTDREGNEKKRYVNLGTLFEYDDGGMVLKLDSIPVGEGFTGFINFYDIEERQERGAGKQQSRGGGSSGGFGGGFGGGSGPRENFSADLDDEIPFASPYGLR